MSIFRPGVGLRVSSHVLHQKLSTHPPGMRVPLSPPSAPGAEAPETSSFWLWRRKIQIGQGRIRGCGFEGFTGLEAILYIYCILYSFWTTCRMTNNRPVQFLLHFDGSHLGRPAYYIAAIKFGDRGKCARNCIFRKYQKWLSSCVNYFLQNCLILL